jgi:ubiquinone/menaquinone biosynthesis C-methylase UbiE
MEFDQFADDYGALHERSIAFSGCEPEYFAAYKIDLAATYFRQFCGNDDSILDFGCGTGVSVPHIRRHLSGTKLICADVSSASLEILHRRFGEETICSLIDTDRLDLPSNSVGMVFSACVFHHIQPEQQLLWLRELYRVTRPGGIIVVFEHNPLNPLTRYAVSRCIFDKNAVLLRPRNLAGLVRKAGWTVRHMRYHVFFPGFLSALSPLEARLGWLALGGQYSVCAVKP